MSRIQEPPHANRPDRLRRRAELVEQDGHLTAARLMLEAAFEIEQLHLLVRPARPATP
jgi:hypothetical protein